jgi:hypothetical protein
MILGYGDDVDEYLETHGKRTNGMNTPYSKKVVPIRPDS